MQSDRSRPIIVITLLLSLGILWQNTGWSAPPKRYLMAGMELFRWQEFNPAQDRLLSEQGARLSLQAGWDDLLPNNRYGKFNLTTHFYSGDINYDGQTQSAVPAQSGIFIASTSRYTGLAAELEGLHPLSNSRSNTALLLALGIDLWRRDIQDSVDAQSNLVGGFTEDYQVIYSRLGLQRQDQGAYGTGQARVGIKYPLRIDEQVIGITLHPERDWSLFASYRLNLADRRHTIIEVYYDSLRLNPSAAVADQYGDAWLQPQSQQDSIGIMFGMPF